MNFLKSLAHLFVKHRCTLHIQNNRCDSDKYPQSFSNWNTVRIYRHALISKKNPHLFTEKYHAYQEYPFETLVVGIDKFLIEICWLSTHTHTHRHTVFILSYHEYLHSWALFSNVYSHYSFTCLFECVCACVCFVAVWLASTRVWNDQIKLLDFYFVNCLSIQIYLYDGRRRLQKK